MRVHGPHSSIEALGRRRRVTGAVAFGKVAGRLIGAALVTGLSMSSESEMTIGDDGAVVAGADKAGIAGGGMKGGGLACATIGLLGAVSPPSSASLGIGGDPTEGFHSEPDSHSGLLLR